MRRLVMGGVVLALALHPWAADAAEDEPAVAGTFRPAGSLAEARAHHSAILLPDGSVFVVGGDGGPEGSFGPLHAAEIWDPDEGAFGPAGSLAAYHGWSPAMLLPDGRVLVVGGYIVQIPASAEIWDSGTGSFSPAGSLAEARGRGTPTMLSDGRVLFVGGMGDGGVGADMVPVTAAEIWDPEAASFTSVGSLAQPRVGHTSTLLPDGRVLVVGGWGLIGSDTASAEVWDPILHTFGPAGPLADGWRFAHTSTLLPDGRVLVVGGTGVDGLPVDTAEVWDPEAASFSVAGSLAEARGGQTATHTATLMPDGRVLIVGGFGGDGAVSSAEIWDPETASFRPAGSLAQARGDHTATLLPDGRVLVVGGRRLEDEVLASVEAWEPRLSSADPGDH